MSVFKNFFSKLFGRTIVAPNETTLEFEDELLKAAAREAVAEAFRTHSSSVTVQKKNDPTEQNTNSAGIKNENHGQHLEHTAVNFKHPDVQQRLKDYNRHFFKAFNISENDYTLKFEKENLYVHVNDAQFEAELSKSDKLSLAYESVFIRLIQKNFKHFDCRLFLQAGDSIRKHRAYTVGLAKKMAVEVKKTRHKVTVASKSSYERSIIHATVAHIPGISSKSVGMSNQRRIVIYPSHLNPDD